MIKSSRSQECWINRNYSVGRSNEEDIWFLSESIHLLEKNIHSSNNFLSATTIFIVLSFGCKRVNFIDKYNTWCDEFCKESLKILCRFPHPFTKNITWRESIEWYSNFIRNDFCWECFSSSWRSVENDSSGWLNIPFFEMLSIFEEWYKFLDLSFYRPISTHIT